MHLSIPHLNLYSVHTLTGFNPRIFHAAHRLLSIPYHTPDGRNPAPSAPFEVGSLSHDLQGFIHLRWLFAISSINHTSAISLGERKNVDASEIQLTQLIWSISLIMRIEIHTSDTCRNKLADSPCKLR